MKIKILKDTRCAGKALKAGDKVTVDNADAVLLINMGKAEPVENKTETKDKSVKSGEMKNRGD